MRNIYTLLGSAFIGAFFLCGCASSERMARISGDVVENYSVPKSHRIRSEKYQKVRMADSDYRMEKSSVEFNKSLINLWPFFFRSDDYISMLWPMVDFDRYGMAIRPFYNHEGDEYSILFPLSGWNSVNGDGWILNAAWNKDFYALFPLAYFSQNPNRGGTFAAFLYIQNWHYNKNITWRAPLREKTFIELLLGYYGKTVSVDISDKEWLLRNRGKDDYEKIKPELIYCFTRDKKTIPANQKELDQLREKEFAVLPDQKSSYWGFFPLFHKTQSKDSHSFNIVGPLFELERTAKSSYLGFLGPLIGQYKVKGIEPMPGRHTYAEESFLSFPLLSRFCTKHYYEETPEVQALKELHRLSSEKHFEKKRPEMQALVKKIDPAVDLPENVIDNNTMKLFLADLTQEKSYSTYPVYEGGFLPLFLYGFSPNKQWWCSPALITVQTKTKTESSFFSLPLLTYQKTSEKEKIFSVAGPLLYYSKFRKADRVDKPILSRKISWTIENNMAEFQDDYAALGLFYHGKDHFYVVREGFSESVVERLRKLLTTLPNNWKDLNNQRDSINKRQVQNSLWKTRDKIEYYQKLIEVEQIRLELEKHSQKEEEYSKLCEEAKILAKSLSFPLEETVFSNSATARASAERLFDAFAEPRKVEDFGNGLFFRKELFYNGNFNWRIFLNLASGKKEDDREEMQILGFIYRDRQQDSKRETMIFPFIAIQEEGEDHRTSFMWRLWETHIQNGKKGGYIFFIPYGD